MTTKLYQQEKHTFTIESNCLRLLPENYLVACKHGSSWRLDPDLAVPLQSVLLVTSLFMEHHFKWCASEEEILNKLNSTPLFKNQEMMQAVEWLEDKMLNPTN